MAIINKTHHGFEFNTNEEQLIFFTDFIEFDNNNKKLYFELKTLKSIFKLSTMEILTSLDCKYDDDNSILSENCNSRLSSKTPDIATYDSDGKLSSVNLIIVEVKHVLKLCDKYLDRDNVRSFRDFITRVILPSDEKIANAYKHYIEEYTDIAICDFFKMLFDDKMVMNKDSNKNEKLFSIKEVCDIINNKFNNELTTLDIYYVMKVSHMINVNDQSLSISLTEKSRESNFLKIIIHDNNDIGCYERKEFFITPEGLDYLINFYNNHLMKVKNSVIIV